ncbi:MAG: hypothetical protein ACJAX4_002373 [Clostridium sp.]|jgi:hypothetical protein
MLDKRPMLSFDNTFLQIPKLLILAFAQEIAFRVFFQTKLCNITKIFQAQAQEDKNTIIHLQLETVSPM